MGVTVRLQGGFDVVVDGRPVDPRHWRRRSAAALVTLLALGHAEDADRSTTASSGRSATRWARTRSPGPRPTVRG